MRIVIIANGSVEPKADLAYWAKQADLLIAADGGADHCLAAGIVPDGVIGDLDSISDSVLKILNSQGKIIISYPAEKDFTDLELAMRYAVDQGGRDHYLGALGARWDMSVANLMLLGADFLKDKIVRLIVENQEAMLLRGPQEIAIQGDPGRSDLPGSIESRRQRRHHGWIAVSP